MSDNTFLSINGDRKMDDAIDHLWHEWEGNGSAQFCMQSIRKYTDCRELGDINKIS